MGLFSWLFGKSKPKPTGPQVHDNVTIDGQPGQQVVTFNSLNELMQLLGSIEPVDQGPKRPLLYMFQFVALRDAAFENHPELIRELSEPPRTSLSLLHFRSRAQLLCEQSGMLPEDDSMDDAAMEAEAKLFAAVQVQSVGRGDFTAHIVTMPAPESSPEAYFAAIVHRDNEPHEYMQPSPSTRYFTLERSPGPARPLLCEWSQDGSRQNYGEIPRADFVTFADAVFRRVLPR